MAMRHDLDRTPVQSGLDHNDVSTCTDGRSKRPLTLLADYLICS